jgi:hypothetical protein
MDISAWGMEWACMILLSGPKRDFPV